MPLVNTSSVRISRSSVLALAAVCVLLGGGAGRAANWPEFRGPTGQGVASAAKLATQWSRQTNVAWRRALAGRGWSSPVIWEGRIYLTSAIQSTGEGEAGKRLSLRALCLAASDGEVLWDTEVFAVGEQELQSVHAKNSYASPTPIVDGQRLYVHFGPHGVAALDLAGDVIWQRTDIDYDARHGGGGSPVLSGEALIFNCDGVEEPFIAAVNCASGADLWRTPRPPAESHNFSFSTPLEIEVAGQRQVVSPASHVVCSYEPASGRELWRVHYPNKWSVIPRPVFAGGKVFVCTGYEGPAELLAIDPTGSGDVTETHVKWRTDRYVSHTPSPVVAGGLLFMMSDEGIAVCYDIETGKRHWHKRLGGNYSASPLLAADLVYVASEQGDFTIFRAAATYEEVSRSTLGEPVLASMATDGEALYIRTEAALYRIDERQK
jgi:outer membrane protein assembly factor BamB